MEKINSKKMRFLNGYLQAKAEVERLDGLADEITEVMRRNKEIAYNKLLPASPAISDMPKAHNSSDKLSEVEAEYLDLQHKYEVRLTGILNAMTWQEDRMQSVIEAIDAVEDETYRCILTERFIHGKTWRQVANAVGYSYYTLKNYKRGRAINSVRIK